MKRLSAFACIVAAAVLCPAYARGRQDADTSKAQAAERRLSTVPEGAECRGFAFGKGSVAYIARKNDLDVVMFNDKAGPTYAHVVLPHVSADGSTVAYWGYVKEKEVRLVVGGKQWDGYTCLYATIVMTADGKHFITCGETAEGWHVIVDGKRGPATKALPRSLSLADDGTYGYTVAIDDAEHVIVNGETKAKFVFADGVAVGIGGTFAYAGDEDETSVIVHNGKAIENVSDATVPALSRDGKVIAFGHKAGGWRLRIGDRDIEVADRPRMVRLSPDGSRAGFLTWTKEKSISWTVDVGEKPMGVEGARFPIVEPRSGFLKTGGERWIAKVGGKEYDLPDYEDGLILGQDALEYGARAGRAVLWRTVKIDR